MDVLKAIEDNYNEKLEELKQEIMLDLKDKPELRSRLDIKSTLRLSRYEGSASNALRDILLTTGREQFPKLLLSTRRVHPPVAPLGPPLLGGLVSHRGQRFYRPYIRVEGDR